MKKLIAILMSALLAAGLLAACAGGTDPSSTAAPSQPESTASEPASLPEPESTPKADPVAVRIAGLKGPTTMGMVKLMDDAENGLYADDYQVEMAGTADEIVPKLVSGELDMAAIPANLAAVLYNNSQGIRVAAINTLGVLYVVETGETIQSIEDLRGKTIYSTGKGTTPEFALNYILTKNGIDPAGDLTIEYKSESTEIAALLAEATDAVAVLPQPYVTAMQMQNENVRIALSLSDEWDKVGAGSSLVTGVLVARVDWIDENPEAFENFLAAYAESINWVNANTEDAAELVAKYGIVEKAPVAAKALPYCNIVCITGDELETRLSGYLQALYDQNPEAVGGALPEAEFYYKG
ncbi:ABC transporter substrate-binding protein [Ruminococcaceae bacterium OttesenSCG-928-D13]|nr:ABC transporter substrate-binding protein [Ruminococcaceae bacterium OttesenSCG-928-D13]